MLYCQCSIMMSVNTLVQVAGGSVGQQVSFPQFKAFNQLLGNLDIMEKIVHEAVKYNDTATKGLLGYFLVLVCFCLHDAMHARSMFRFL